MASAQEPVLSSVAVAEDVEWQDFDEDDVFQTTKKEAAAATCRNFVLEFGANNAQIVRDLSKDQFSGLLHQAERGTEYPIRWINIWDTSSSAEVVKLIGQKYTFSQRLISLMVYATQMKQRDAQSGRKKSKATTSRNGSRVQVGDEEKGLTDGSSEPPPEDQAGNSLPSLEGEEIELYLLLKDTVNYSSVDHTEKGRPDQRADVVKNKVMPPKHWMWLVLCDDHTVITFHEGHKPEATPEGWSDEDWQSAQYMSMRANSMDVLLQQSKRGMALYEHRPLSQNSIRQALKKALDRTSSTKPELSRVHSDVAPVGTSPGTTLEDEGTSSLFYYLFEDYSAAGPLNAAGKILDQFTPKVLHSADRNSRVKSRDIIQPLHILSKDLRNLKHLFENYLIVIGKILAATKRPGPPHLDPRASLMFRTESNLSESLIMSSDPGRKVFLTSSALQRFDRLRDRLRGIMLNTIDGHLKEITALQQTYFNLTQQKDSAATAKLTRSATLLAKLSVFFLPISFVTSYFSVQIEDLYIYWDKNTYWYTFAVTATVSFLALFFFGKLLMFFSDVMDDWAEKISSRFGALMRRFGFNVGKEEDED